MWEDYENDEWDDDRDVDDEELEGYEFCEQDAYGEGDCMCEMCQYYRKVGQ